MAEIFERTAAISKQAAIFKASQHDFVRSVLTANNIPCPADPDAFAKILKKLPAESLLASFSLQKQDDQLTDEFQAVVRHSLKLAPFKEWSPR